jgi:iron complex transport system substrate-binding protein
MHTRKAIVAAFVAVALVTVAACGGDDDDSASGDPSTTASPSSAPAASFPVTVTGANGKVTIDAQPKKIVSLSPSSTEDLFAIGAGDQVVAVDDQSNYPADAPKTDLSGYTPNVEAIGGYDPDLVVMSDPSVAKELKSISVPLLVLAAPTTLDEAYEQIETLGRATGHPQEASDVVAGMKSDIEDIVSSTPKSDPPLTYYYELDQNLYTATSKTFIGNVFSVLGLKNIGDPADDGSGYPQLSGEFLLNADPDLVFLADTKCCQQSAKTVAARPGWSSLAAVTNDHVVELDDDVASRWGPRVVDLLQTVAKEVQSVDKGTTSTSS